MNRRRWLWCAIVSANAGCAIAGSHAKIAPAPPPAPTPVAAPVPPSTAPDGIAIVLVKGGCFRMGNALGAGGPDEKPVHEVCVEDFYMGVYEVMREQWQEVMGTPAAPSNPKCGDACPVEMVSWDDAQAFIARLNERSGRAAGTDGRYRLPTEAEWEYAARSGGKDELYAGGGTDVERVAWSWYDGGAVQNAGLRAPNGLGLYDMSGNVWEWTADWYGETYYASSPRMNPTGPDSGERRVLRGGSAKCPPFDLRTTYRNRLPPGYRGAGKGFRVVLSVPGQAR